MVSSLYGITALFDGGTAFIVFRVEISQLVRKPLKRTSDEATSSSATTTSSTLEKSKGYVYFLPNVHSCTDIKINVRAACTYMSYSVA